MTWSRNREIIEFKQTLEWRNGPFAGNDYYFKKINNRWHWGYLTCKGPKYNDHPFATQREAKQAAKDYNDGKRDEVDGVLEKMRGAKGVV